MKSRCGTAPEAREAEAEASEKAWEAGPRWEVRVARGVAAHRCDDLPGPGHQGTWVCDSPPQPRYLWKEAQSCSVQPRRGRSLQVAGDPGLWALVWGSQGAPRM